jgi:GNAT superfamily N-acetyltransferase
MGSESESSMRLEQGEVVVVPANEAHDLVPDLAALLLDAVGGGASVSFMRNITRDEAEAFWRCVVDGVVRGERALLVAREKGDGARGRLLGTAQLVFAQQPNQPHRADVAKVLVFGHARRRGVARALMSALEVEARRRGRTLLTLDTVVGSAADHLYLSAGYTRVGEIDGYALMPDGRPAGTAIFFKHLG